MATALFQPRPFSPTALAAAAKVTFPKDSRRFRLYWFRTRKPLLIQFSCGPRQEIRAYAPTCTHCHAPVQGKSGGKAGRVALGITPQGSHRSGRAQLRHPARLGADLPARCYPWPLRGHAPKVQSPRRGARPRIRNEAPPPIPRVQAQMSPEFDRIMQRSDSLPPSRRASLSFAWRYHDGRRCFAPVDPERVIDRPGLGNPVPLAGKNIVERTGRPRFPGNPAAPMPCSTTPAGPATPCHDGVPTWPPG
jgi:hypothetical protein